MSWAITVSFPNVVKGNPGTASATWTDPNLAFGVFTFSENVQADVKSGNAFVAKAIAARDHWQTVQQGNIDKAAWVLGVINAADPKAV